jgi:hypothetical protein
MPIFKKRKPDLWRMTKQEGNPNAQMANPPERTLFSIRIWSFLPHPSFVIFLGNVGRNFAMTTNAIPIATRKKEKNCPRVKTPTSGASGSRKFSQMIRKIA